MLNYFDKIIWNWNSLVFFFSLFHADRPRDMLTKTLSLVKYNLKSQKTMTMMMKMRTLSLYPRLINRKVCTYLVSHAKVWLSKLTLYFQEKLKMVFNRLYPPNLRKRSNSLLYLHLLQNYQHSPNHRNRKIKSRTWNFRKRKSRKASPL